METPSAYTGIVSPRSRRLRMIGGMLLLAVLAMILYGYFGLMPSLARAARESAASGAAISAPARLDRSESRSQPQTHAQRVRKLQVAVALAYWGVCGLVLLAVLLVAWLDLREISRSYVAERRAMWTQAASQYESPDDAP